MIHIAANRSLVSDRFPIASFQIKAPPSKLFEVACATDARLFHPSYRGQRSTRNFYTSSGSGLLRARMGEATWLLPPQALRDFAGHERAPEHAKAPLRLYYALGAYGNERGDDPEFSISPDRLDGVPFVQMSPDFTGRAWKSHSQCAGKVEGGRYGGMGAALTWGGDHAFSRYGAGEDQEESGQPYPGQESAALLVEEEEPPGYEDAQDMAAHEVAAPIEEAEPPGVEHVSELVAPAAPPGPAPSAAGAGRYGAGSTLRHAPASSRTGRDGRTGRVMGADPAREEFVPPGRTEDYSDEDVLEAVALSIEDDTGGAPSTPVPFTDAEKRLVLYSVARFESGLRPADIGDPERLAKAYGACNRNTDGAGLSYGFIQFTQKSGNLGRLLRRLQERDGDRFAGTFVLGEELLATTNAADAGHRMQPVGGEELWSDVWVGRFREAARVPAFQEEQDRLAIELFVSPNLRLAGLIGFDTDRALAMLLDRCIQQGNGGGRSWILSRVGPLSDDSVRRKALEALGFARLRDFQSSFEGLTVDGKWGPMTHSAMMASLRALGDRSPIVVPGREEMLDGMVAHAEAEQRPWAHRVRSLRQDAELLRGTRYSL